MVGTGPASASCRELLARVTDAVLSVLLPARCVGCGEFETFLCPSCALTLEPLDGDNCSRCGAPRPRIGPGPALTAVQREVVGAALARTSTSCAVCVGAGFSFASARSAFLYRGAARALVSSFKHGGQRCLAPTMARLAAPAFDRAVDDLGRLVVTWVPSHGSVERMRGYNQAEVFARALAEGCGGLPVARLARKSARTAHQQGLGRDSRRRNLADAFRPVEWPQRGQDIEGVVLVDDVFTTGATTSEVAAVIHRASGLPVHVFTFARTVSPTGGTLA